MGGLIRIPAEGETTSPGGECNRGERLRLLNFTGPSVFVLDLAGGAWDFPDPVCKELILAWPRLVTLLPPDGVRLTRRGGSAFRSAALEGFVGFTLVVVLQFSLST